MQCDIIFLFLFFRLRPTAACFLINDRPSASFRASKDCCVFLCLSSDYASQAILSSTFRRLPSPPLPSPPLRQMPLIRHWSHFPPSLSPPPFSLLHFIPGAT